MLKQFSLWLICFATSIVADIFGWWEQEVAFFFIEMGVVCFLITIIIIMGLVQGELAELKLSYILTLTYAIIIILAWVTTTVFDVDFFMAYQILSFIKCLTNMCGKNKL